MNVIIVLGLSKITEDLAVVYLSVEKAADGLKEGLLPPSVSKTSCGMTFSVFVGHLVQCSVMQRRAFNRTWFRMCCNGRSPVKTLGEFLV